MKVVPDWKEAWKWYSVQGPVLGLAAIATWAMLPDEFKNSYTPLQLQIAGACLFVFIIGGRIVDQK